MFAAVFTMFMPKAITKKNEPVPAALPVRM
jgi:hypothetical protein